MKIELKKDWFDPSGNLLEVRNNPHDVPEEWGAKPKKADGETDAEFELRKDQPFNILPTTARVLKDSEVVDVERKTADGTIVIEEQAVGEGAKVLGGKAGDPAAAQEVQLPDATVRTPAPMLKPEPKK